MPSPRSMRRPFPLLLLVALAAFFFLGALPGAAKTPGTVKIGGQVKKTVGTLTELQAGDVACYLSLEDDQGEEFQELGEFEICEKTSLLHKRVTLTYELGKVIAEECQGDPECKKTRTVPLVTSIRVAKGKPAARKPE